MNLIKRRQFLASLSATALTFIKGSEAKAFAPFSVQKEENALQIRKYNSLGNTGLKVSDVSCGAISLFEPNVLRYAYDCGINYFDTAEGYLRTKSESFIGQALKDVRDKIIITTKHAYDFKEKVQRDQIIKRMEASLKRLQTDYVDIAMVHNIDDITFLQSEEFQSAYAKLKKEGKIRFTGFSTHNPKLTLKQALDTDFAQVILFIYNHMEGKEIEPLIKDVRQKGIGTVAMKVFAGGMQGNLQSLVSKETSYPQAAIRWVLSNPHVDCCIVTLSSYSHVEEYVAASAKPLDRTDLKVIGEYQHKAQSLYCRVSCQECLPSCPHRVAINEVLRYAMYFENYRMEKEAVRYYSELDEAKKPLSCENCAGYCETACPFGLAVRSRLLHSHEILSA